MLPIKRQRLTSSSQQAYRARREQLVNQLRSQIAQITQQHMSAAHERERLHKMVQQLQEENRTLRQLVKTRVVIGEDNDFTFSSPWQSGGQG
jgi:ElaB/YqjD/DUF883 family membrane-anchored ribosome-binding protein